MNPHLPSSLRRLFAVLSLLLCLTWANAQNISIKSFKLLPTDLTANLEGTKEIDQNGETAALIKVITTETGFVFDVGMLGIVRQVQQVGEIWVYVPHGVQRISINHQKLGRLAEPYYFDIPIEAARTYELELTTNRVKTIIEEDAGGGYVALKVTPPTAMVFVDDQARALGPDGTLSLFLLYGTHAYRVEAPGYKPESGTVNITSDETQTLSINLQSTASSLTLTTPMADAEIWVNNERKSVGSWTGALPAGSYVIETRKAGCRTQRTTVTLAESEERTLTLQAPEPIFGRLRAESSPVEVEVWLGNAKLGTSPGVINNVPVGKHTLRFVKEGYESQTVEVTIEEGKIATASALLAASSQPSPQGKGVRQEKQKDKTPRLQAGKASNARLFSPLSLYAGADLQIGAPLAAGASLGGYLSGFNIEASFGIPFGGTNSPVPVEWTILDNEGFAESTFTQSYSSSFITSGHIGYGIPVARFLRLTPRVGVSAYTIKSSSGSPYTQTTYVLSGVAALRTEVAFNQRLGIHITPQYNLPLSRGKISQDIGRASSDIHIWNNGFYLSVGLWINLFSAK